MQKGVLFFYFWISVLAAFQEDLSSDYPHWGHLEETGQEPLPSVPCYGPANIDFDEMDQGYVLETKKIDIPGYPESYNPSVVRWKGKNLLIFRTYDLKTRVAHHMGLVFLDEEFRPLGSPQLLRFDFQDPDCILKRQDPRLISIGGRLFIVYNNVLQGLKNREVRRMLVAEIHEGRDGFYADAADILLDFEGRKEIRSEKNWVPFDYLGELLFGYSLSPHKVLRPLLADSSCTTVASFQETIPWDWGILRGGTPALLVDGRYLAFFHSSIDIPSAHSNGKKATHYFMGAYTFSPHPPFRITHISPEPLFSQNFYRGPFHKTWKPLHVIFPGGYVFDSEFIWVVYGRQDHEVWVAKIDKQKLLNSLRKVAND